MNMIIFYQFYIFILFSFETVLCLGKTAFARGVEGGDPSKCINNLLLNLPNESFSASSVWQNRPEFEAYQARMSTMIDTGSNNNGQAWCSNNLVSLNSSEWVEIDLGDLKLIGSFFTMGRGEGNFKEFMSLYYFDYQRETGKWIRYKNNENKELMIGNGDSRNVARTQFESLIVARKIRIYPISQDSPSRACMKIGIYGCNFEDGVVEYSMPQGHLYIINGNDKYDFRDLTYDGRLVNYSLHSQQLYGGLGQLMDNVVYHGTIQNEKNENIPGFHFVGWNRKIMESDQLEIIIKLDQIRQLKEIRLFTLNMIPKEIGVFTNANIHFSIGGEIYDYIASACHFKTSIDRRVYHSRWIDIPLQGVLARFLKISLVFDLEWIVLSEIILTSEKSYVNIPIEENSQEKVYTTLPIEIGHSTKYQSTLPFSKSSTQHSITKVNVRSNEASFIANSNIGFIVILASCILGLLLLLSLIICGFVFIKQRYKHTKGKFRYPTNPLTTNGGQFIGDSLTAPLTGKIHNISQAEDFYIKSRADLGLSYPIMGKEYMTLSSKSGTDYDMAGGNSLDGLIPTYKDSKYSSHFSQNTLSDNPYPVPTYSRHSFDGSLGSSYTEYATTSLHHFPQVLEDNNNLMAYFSPGFINNNFQLQALSPNHNSFNRHHYNIQSPTPSCQILVQQNITDMFPQYSPYRYVSNINNYSPMHSTPSKYPKQLHMNNYFPHLIPDNSNNISQYPSKQNFLPPLQGVFGSSTMISTAEMSDEKNKIHSLTELLSSLEEINQDNIEDISIIGRGEQGVIGFIKTLQRNVFDDNDSVLSNMYLSKSLKKHLSKDTRNAIVREMSVLMNIKHSAFLQLSSYAFNHLNLQSMKQLKLCFLFKINEPMENLHMFLQQYSGAQDFPRDYILYPQSISNLSKIPNLDSQMYPSIQSLLYICCQIAKGMNYLEVNKIVHRDLAARNCLLGHNLLVKITDIAMSIPKFKDHYNECTTMEIQTEDTSTMGSSLSVVKQSYPLQWMAFETILQGSYNIKTDIWSFGVTMWEIFTKCQSAPFGKFGIGIDKLVDNANHLKAGNQAAILPSGILHKQHNRQYQDQNNANSMLDYSSSIFDSSLGLHKDFSDLIKECWHKNPIQRPSFHNICLFLEQKISTFTVESS